MLKNLKLFLSLFCFSLINFSNSSELVDSSNDLALHLLHVLPTDHNSFFSPLIISSSMLSLLNGAKGVTEKELRHFLNIGDEEKLEDVNNDMKTLLKLMTEKNNKDLIIKLANLMLISDEFPLKQDFQKRMRENFNTTIDLVDFKSYSANITKEINNWVNDQTNGKIHRLFDDLLSSETTLVLANAIYFHGKWKYAFDPKNTGKGEFYSIGDSNIGLTVPSKVDFMQIKGKFGIEFVPDLSAILLELPFSGDSDMSMAILIPDESNDFYDMMDKLSAETLRKGLFIVRNSTFNDVVISMPKFKIESEYDLKERLEELGIKSLFHNDANLSEINGKQNLKVSAAIHKAYIEVNEEGAEAGVANGLAFENRALPPVITIDRSFLFLIIDGKSGLILFGGQVRSLVDEELLSLGLI